MADERVVSTKLEQIEQYHGELIAKQRLPRETLLDDTTEQRAVERMFENVIQACADLAQHIATRDFGYDGGASKEAIRTLGRRGVLDEGTAHKLVAAVGFRNVLAHEYGTVEHEQVYQLLQTELAVYDEFGRQVAQWFRDEGATDT